MRLRSIRKVTQDDNLTAILLGSLQNSKNTFNGAIENKYETKLLLKYFQNALIDRYLRRIITQKNSTKFEYIVLKDCILSIRNKTFSHCNKNNYNSEDCFHLNSNIANKQKHNFMQDRSRQLFKNYGE